MKLWINALIVTLLLHGVSVFAQSRIYLYGEALPNARGNTHVFNGAALQRLAEKYHLHLKTIGPANAPFFQLRARELRSGVYVLQFRQNHYTGDLVFKDFKAAQDFEAELKITTATDKFYGQPVGYQGTNEVIAVGYMEKYPTDQPRYKVRYHFLNNRWGWKPEKNE